MPDIESEDFKRTLDILSIRQQISAAQEDESIKTLGLSYSEFNRFSNQHWDICFKGLEKTHINSVDLSDSSLNEIGIAGLKKILAVLSKVKSLDLSSNNLDEFGSALFTEALKPLEDTEVTALDLSNNKSSDFEIKQFAQGLLALKNTRLSKIGLRALNVYEGFTETVNALKETPIISVDFAYNELYRLGATAPQKFEILKNSQIKQISFGYNKLYKLGAENFVTWLIALANTPIICIDLCGNNINEINNLHKKLVEKIPFPISLEFKKLKLKLNIHEEIKEISFIDFYLQNLARHLVDDINKQMAQPKQERIGAKIKIIEPSVSIDSKQFTALIEEDGEQLKILIKALENIKQDSTFEKAPELILLQIDQLSKTSSKRLYRSAPTFFKEPKNRDDDKDLNPSHGAQHTRPDSGKR